MCYALAVIPGWSEGPDPPFLLNGATELLKWLTSANTTGGKARFILAVLSMIGVLSACALNVTPLDVSKFSGLLQEAFLAAAPFLAAHGTFGLITGKTEG